MDGLFVEAGPRLEQALPTSSSAFWSLRVGTFERAHLLIADLPPASVAKASGRGHVRLRDSLVTPDYGRAPDGGRPALSAGTLTSSLNNWEGRDSVAPLRLSDEVDSWEVCLAWELVKGL